MLNSQSEVSQSVRQSVSPSIRQFVSSSVRQSVFADDARTSSRVSFSVRAQSTRCVEVWVISRLQRSVESFIFVVPQAVDDDDEDDGDADADDDNDDDVDGPAHEFVLACLPS